MPERAQRSTRERGPDQARTFVEGARRRLLRSATDMQRAVGVPARAQKQAGKRASIRRRRSIFAALDATPFDAVKVVDPRPGSVPRPGPGARPVLLGAAGRAGAAVAGQHLQGDRSATSASPRPDHGCLMPWARQGVLLLNAVLTVEDGRAGSHQGKGWEGFTDHVRRRAQPRARRPGVPALGQLRAGQGQADRHRSRHRVLKAPHPSPLSAHRGFIGCGHFSARQRVPGRPRRRRRSTGRCRRAQLPGLRQPRRRSTSDRSTCRSPGNAVPRGAMTSSDSVLRYHRQFSYIPARTGAGNSRRRLALQGAEC